MNNDNEVQSGTAEHLRGSGRFGEDDTVGGASSSTQSTETRTRAGHSDDLDSGMPGATPVPGEFGANTDTQPGAGEDMGVSGGRRDEGRHAAESRDGIAGTGSDVGSETGIAGSGADNSLDSGTAGYGAEGEDFNS